MNTGKLISISISNFGPFANETIFSTVSDSTKKEFLTENTFEIKENRYNKVSYIYGANGAGKSNFCKALLQIQNYLALAPIFASNNPQLMEMASFKRKSSTLQNPYKFDVAYSKKPTSFSIEILLRGIIYKYSFSTFDGKIINEKLTKKNKRTEIILERTSPLYTDITLRSELKGFENNISVVKENVLCLSMADFLNIKLANDIIQTIQSIRVVNMSVMNLAHVTEESCTTERIEKYLKVLRVADPTLKNIKVNFNEQKVERQKVDVPDLEDRELIVRSVKIDVASTHSVYDGEIECESSEVPFLQIESNGTIKLFGILPAIFDTLESGGTIIIDEIENGLHTRIVKKIIELFNNESTNPFNAQLICTSHCQELIYSGVRRDQIWIVSKTNKGLSSLKRVSDIAGMRAYETSGKKYLENAFVDIPLSIFM